MMGGIAHLFFERGILDDRDEDRRRQDRGQRRILDAIGKVFGPHIERP